MKKLPKRITAAYLDRVALHYLERFSTSSENLRRVLLRRVQRSAAHWDEDPAEGARLVEELLARYLRSGLLDDKLYAEGKVRSLHRRGGSARAIRQALAAKGVEAELVDTSLAALAEDAPSGELDYTAALNYARRRRLGPYRSPDRRAEMRDKDLAALGRAGFAYAIARRVVDGEED